MPVYKNPKEAILGLIRIFGPCHLSLILGELRTLLRAKGVIEEKPYGWVVAKRSYVKDDVVKYIEELWISGEIYQAGERWLASTAKEKVA